ncbi:hypothetical protein Salat_0203800 [Sesamum alatum]|uniref:Reverse transcriptase zinc-binding domain-containing protein n=1 Tax=Sesamum alatum TaxID=300844 RepID=A0AAE2CY15_9LAMI|nr:hypothetical protein Salat_0203800 [Sesamum alatum]
MGDRNTKFFHDLVKRNAAKRSINAITKNDGTTITSTEEIGHEFVAFFTSLWGTEAQTSPVDNDCLQDIRYVSGLAVNNSKSSIFTARIQNNELHEIRARTEFAAGVMPVRYLGIPLAEQWLSIGDYSPLVDKIANNITKWAANKADTLWVKWGNGVYLKGSSIWEWQPKRGDSPLLQRLSQIHDRIIGAVGSPQAAKQLIETWASSKGLATSKTYEYFRLKQARQPWQAMIWPAYIPPKFTFILWLGIRERLSTRARLAFLHEETSCSLYINRSESAKHLSFDCPFSERVWSDIQKWLGINRRMSTILSAIKWLKKEKIGSSVQNKARLLALACMVYNLWRHRNKVIFEAKAPSINGLVISIKIRVFRILLSFFPQGTFAL